MERPRRFRRSREGKGRRAESSINYACRGEGRGTGERIFHSRGEGRGWQRSSSRVFLSLSLVRAREEVVCYQAKKSCFQATIPLLLALFSERPAPLLLILFGVRVLVCFSLFWRSSRPPPPSPPGSISVLDVCADVLELSEDLREECRLRVDSQHRLGQQVDDPDASVPEAVFVGLDQKRLQRVADLVAHVAGGWGGMERGGEMHVETT